MTMFRRGLKNSVKNKLMRDERRVEDLKTLIEMTIDLNDKLYERIIEKRYSKRHFERKNYQIEQRERNVRFETSRNQKRSNDTMFMKLNAVLFRKFKSKKKTKKK